jgi:hypothetical protein
VGLYAEIIGDYLEVWCESPANIMPHLLRSMGIVLSISVFVALFLCLRFYSAAVSLSRETVSNYLYLGEELIL